ncbi:MAG TPA: zinc-binding alcohol dehydrogenase family protein [Chloroflexota bacterium]|nr:zinc-binding alcohol dehydrogenase family protein [Chloroflexota bacterium]
MRAVVTMAPRHMELVEQPTPAAGPDEALVRVEAVGLCGSDVLLYLGKHPYARYPQIQGHEFSGIVESFGGSYDGPIQVGDRVAVEPLQPCCECYPCRHGRANCCTRLAVLGAHVPGALVDSIAVRTSTLYPVGDLDAQLAALVEPISIGLQGVNRGAVTAEDLVVIFGAGPIGQAVLLASVERGARVLVVDRLPSRLDLARRLGAEAVVDAGIADPPAVIAEWTNGDGPGVVFEATGVPQVIRTAVDVVASAGRIVILGLSSQEVSLPVLEFTRKELTILGSRNNAGIFADAVEVVRRNRARAGLLITHRFPLEQTPQALQFALEHPTEAEKVMILMGEVG